MPDVRGQRIDLAERPRRQRRPEETLARLIAAAATIFGNDGYAHARIQDICRTAGVSVGTFYEHFEGKADLLLHIAQIHDEQLLFPDVTSRDDLERQLAEAAVSPLGGIFRAWLEAVDVEPQVRLAHARMRRAHLDEYTRWVREVRAQRQVTARVIEDRATARAIIALLNQVLAATFEPALPQAAELARAVWYLLFAEQAAVVKSPPKI